MIFARITEISAQGTALYVQLYVAKGADSVNAEASLNPSLSAADAHSALAAACRQALTAASISIDVDEPVRLFGGAIEVI
jgi:hypothetical protein